MTHGRHKWPPGGTWLACCLAVVSAAVSAEQPDGCTALTGAALLQCEAVQQQRQQQELTSQQQLLLQVQQQLQQQQQQIAQQQEQLRQQEEQLAKQQQEILRQRTAQENSSAAAQSPTERTSAQPRSRAKLEEARRAELRNWKADNAWFGSDYIRTQFALSYARQLENEQPDLQGRPLLEAISAKVRETYGDR